MDFSFKGFLLVLALATPFLYLLPAIVGFVRKKRNKWAIGLLDLLLGWTALGWIVAMILALGSDARRSIPSAE